MRVSLTSYEGAAGSLRRMAPWFYTMAFVMLFGVTVGDRLMGSQVGQAVTFAVPICALLYGAYRMMTQAPPAPHELELRHERITITRNDGTAAFRAARSETTILESAYTMHSKYGTHTFPVLDLTAGDQHARLSVWDPRPEFAFVQASPGKKPHYLVAVSDWEDLVSALR